MTKEEAIKHLHTYSSTNGSGLTTQDQHEEAKKMAIKALETQPGWIPVTEKPIEDGQYIVTLKDDKEVWTDIAEWNPTFGGRWQAEFFDCEYHDIDNVVAWMPLPKPYREGGQDG